MKGKGWFLATAACFLAASCLGGQTPAPQAPADPNVQKQSATAPTAAEAKQATRQSIAQPDTPAVPDTAETRPRALTATQRADILMARKLYRDAIELYREDYLEAWKKLPILYNKIGIGYHQMNQLDLALEHYRNALRFDPTYAEAINNIGTVYYAQGKHRDAERQYRAALKHNANSASIYSNLGTALFARKKYEDAAEAYQRALEIDPDIFEQRSSGGGMLQERNVEERAKFHFYLSKLYAGRGQIDRALLYMRHAIEEGFGERERFVKDPEFAALQENPEFQKLLEYQPRVL